MTPTPTKAAVMQMSIKRDTRSFRNSQAQRSGEKWNGAIDKRCVRYRRMIHCHEEGDGG